MNSMNENKELVPNWEVFNAQELIELNSGIAASLNFDIKHLHLVRIEVLLSYTERLLEAMKAVQDGELPSETIN